MIGWGAQPQCKVLELYRSSDIFVLASKIVADGDRDGLPNVLLEAQSQGLCCVATNISGIPELIVQEVTGIMTPSNSPEQLARQLQRLIADPALRTKLGQAGLKCIRKDFNVDAGVAKLVGLFNA